VLLALGVSRDTVRADYLLTNELVRDPARIESATPLEARAVLWRVQQGFLDTALEIVDDDHGGIERYLAQRLRLSPAARRALAERYLQPPDTN
jgi:protein-tyrosine phosphatase